MTFTELFKDFLDTTKERLKTPISGAFLWSFIIYNWRPILFLLFSNESIENKIIVINHEYCSPGALIWPIVMAMFYTLMIPRLMLEIDKNLAKTNDDRITKRYDGREHLLLQKKKVAKVEYQLKEIESGSQTIDELNAQIDGLKETNKNLQESIKQINESHKVTVDELNNSLQIAKEVSEENLRKKGVDASGSDNPLNLLAYRVEDMYSRIKFKILLESSKYAFDTQQKVLKVSDVLTKEEFDFIKNAELSGRDVNISLLADLNLTTSLKEKGVLNERIQRGVISYTFTEIGAMIRKLLRDNN